MPAVPRIDVTPARGPVDGAMTIELSGFPPRREVMLRATLDDARGRGWSSQAVFHTDGSGAVDLASTAPLSGCYTDADAEGLLWSLEPAGEAPKAPFDESSLASLNVTFWAEQDGTSVASATVERYVLASDCRAIALKQDGLVGTLFRPAGDGPFPTVLVIGGSQGGQGFSAQTAALLAGHGYASLALSYFADEGLPEHLVGIRLEYFARAMSWLRAQPFARDDGLAVIGRSRGGELALNGRIFVCSGQRLVAFVGVSIPEGTRFSDGERARLSATSAALVVPLRVASLLADVQRRRSPLDELLEGTTDAIFATDRRGVIVGSSKPGFGRDRDGARDRGADGQDHAGAALPTRGRLEPGRAARVVSRALEPVTLAGGRGSVAEGSASASPS